MPFMPNRLAAAAASLAVPLASAQQVQAASETPAKPLATVEVKANLDTVRQNDTASRTVVGHEELVKYGDPSALDVLKRLPGVTVVDGGVRMRGLGAGYTQVLVNGERAPSGFSLESLAPDQIEKIEIVRAASAEYSLEAIAGTINIVLRKTTGKQAAEFKFSGGGGPGHRQQGITLGKSGKWAGAGYTVGATLNHSTRSYREQESIRSTISDGGIGAARDTRTLYDQAFDTVNLNARLNWAPGDGDSLTWQTFYNGGRSRGTEDNRTVTLAGPAYPYANMPVDWYIRPANLRSELSLEKHRDGGAKLEAKAAFDYSRVVRHMARNGFQEQTPTLAAVDEGRFRDPEFTTSGKYLVPLLEGHAFAFGWDAGRERDHQHDIRTEQPLGARPPLELDASYTATVSRLALYGQDEWEVRPGWSLYLGARWEGVRIASHGDAFGSAASSYRVFGPLLQSLWKIPGSKQDQLRLALTRTYRAPTMQQLLPAIFYANFNTEVSADYGGNAGLRPELATGVDAAFEHYFNGGGLVSLSLTRRDIRDFIRDNLVLRDGRWLMRPINQGKARVDSLALETKLPLKHLGLDWPVEARADLARNWSDVKSVPGPGNRLDGQPRWTGNLGADYTGARLSLGASFKLVTGGWVRTSNREARYRGVNRELEAYALARFDARRQLRFTAKNLLAPDRLSGYRYVDAPGASERERSGVTQRSWRLQYEQKFD